MKSEGVPQSIPGAGEAHDRIRSGTTREAFRELLRTALRLQLDPRHAPLGKETGFSFGPTRYPLCRVNRSKGIVFHESRQAPSMIIRSTRDDSFRVATQTLERLTLRRTLDA